MGLDTTHDAWHGAYSAFSRWREKLAEVAGFTFHYQVEGWSEEIRTVIVSGHHIEVDLDWGSIERTIGSDLFGRWPRVPTNHLGEPEPLIVLLAHSDCEGEIQVDMLAPLADRLEELLPLLGDEDGGGHIGSYREKTEQFIRGLRAAANAGEALEFH